LLIVLQLINFIALAPTYPAQHTSMNNISLKQFKATTEQFYASVRAEYTKLANVKKNGRQVFSQEYILGELALKFFRSPKTIENIIFNRVAPKKMPTPVNCIAVKQPAMA
jgi:hypothetical protein